MNSSLRDAVFTGRSFGDYATSLVREWKVYYSLVFWHRWRWCQGTAPFHTWGVKGFWSVLWCAESLRDCGVFFTLVQVRLRDVHVAFKTLFVLPCFGSGCIISFSRHLTKCCLFNKTMYKHNEISQIAKDVLNAIRFLHTIDYKRNPIKDDLLNSRFIWFWRESSGLWHQNVNKYYRLIYVSYRLVSF